MATNFVIQSGAENVLTFSCIETAECSEIGRVATAANAAGDPLQDEHPVRVVRDRLQGNGEILGLERFFNCLLTLTNGSQV